MTPLSDVVVEAEQLAASLRTAEEELRRVDELTNEFAGWTTARDRLHELVGDVTAIEDYCRRVLAGEQDTAPEKALEHIQMAAGVALARVNVADIPTRGEGT